MTIKNQIFIEPGNKSSFKVPDRYFESLASRIDDLIDQAEAEKRIVSEKETGFNKSRFLTLRPILYMAAMFVVLFFSITAILNFSSKNKTTLLTSTSTSDSKQVLTAEDYLISSLGTDGIAEYYINPDIFEE